jgi:hypothetical protein
MKDNLIPDSEDVQNTWSKKQNKFIIKADKELAFSKK